MLCWIQIRIEKYSNPQRFENAHPNNGLTKPCGLQWARLGRGISNRTFEEVLIQNYSNQFLYELKNPKIELNKASGKSLE